MVSLDFGSESEKFLTRISDCNAFRGGHEREHSVTGALPKSRKIPRFPTTNHTEKDQVSYDPDQVSETFRSRIIRVIRVIRGHLPAYLIFLGCSQIK